MRDVQPLSPPAPYQGGKRNLAKRLIARIEAIPHATYAEVFVGMGGVFFRRRQAAKAEIINDFSCDVSNLFRILQRHYPQLLDTLRFQITSRAEFERLRAANADTLTDLERAARFLYLQRTAFGGKVAGRAFGVQITGGARFNLTKLEPMLAEAHERLAGVVIGGAISASQALAERLDAPVCCGYQHNDAFPGSHPLFAGPLGYNGSKAAMELIAQADVVLALGTRLNPFSTLPGYGMNYWPEDAKIIQVDINPDRIGLTKPVSVGIVGDARQVAEQVLAQLSATAGDAGRGARKTLISTTKSTWAQTLTSMDHEDDDEGTDWNKRARADKPDAMSPRKAWRAIQAALPKEAIISSDIGNVCAIGNAYPTFENGRKYLAPGLFGPCGYSLPAILGAKIGRPDTPVVGFAGDGAFGISMNEMTACGRDEWPAITMVIFRNYQWGAEKRNTTLWYHDNFVGTELDYNVSYAGIAQACGVTGVVATTMDGLTDALDTAVKAQMQDSKTTFIEVMLNQEMGEPFRRDAMTTPVEVAGISASDMRSQVMK